MDEQKETFPYSCFFVYNTKVVGAIDLEMYDFPRVQDKRFESQAKVRPAKLSVVKSHISRFIIGRTFA